MTSVTETKRDRFADAFIARLERLVEEGDRGALATLRRGLGKEVPFETYRFMPFRPAGWQEDAGFLVGPLFALWHQGKDEVRNAREDENLGASMLALVNAMVREGTDRNDAMKRVERRFSALLNCHADDLKPHLRHAVSRLKSKEVPVNWQLLLRHVQQWSHEDRWVQLEWARSFWALKREDSEAFDEDSASGTSEEIDANGSVE
jgi:CRISPR system Cascade subunit CasB